MKEVLCALSSGNRVALQIMNSDTAWKSSDATNQFHISLGFHVISDVVLFEPRINFISVFTVTLLIFTFTDYVCTEF